MAKATKDKKSPAKSGKVIKPATKKPQGKKAAAKLSVAKKPVSKTKNTVKKTTPASKVSTKKPLAKKAVAAKSSAAKPALKPRSKALQVSKAKSPTLQQKKSAPTPLKPTAKSSTAKKSTTIVNPSTKVVKPMSSTKAPTSASKAKTPAPVAPPKPVKRTLVYKPAKLPVGYKPSEKEEYMNPLQQEYFRQKLITWRDELLSGSRETLEHLHEEDWHQADIADRASLETEAGVELRTRNRYLKLIAKIDAAIARIETGEYGYCEETGENIGIKRLEARPVATMTIEAQERHEKLERQYTDED